MCRCWASLFQGFGNEQDSILLGLHYSQKADSDSYSLPWEYKREPPLQVQRHGEGFMEEATLR